MIGAMATGTLNAITDVEGVRVGHKTLIKGDGALVIGSGPVRTGVTVIQPRATWPREQPLFAGAFTLNGNGEFTGLEWVRESGLLTTPIALTNTHSVGVVRDAIIACERREVSSQQPSFSLPAVAETSDRLLNDMDGQHVTSADVCEALESASAGPVAEGNVGGGTGMICHGFKGGIGTSSRVVSSQDGGWTVGVLVQANYGRRDELRVDGVPVGTLIPVTEIPAPSAPTELPLALPSPDAGSIIVVVATDAPLLPDQCRRLAMRAAIGVSRVGGGTSGSSGDIMIAFSTGNANIPAENYGPDVPLTYELTAVAHQHIGSLLRAASDATEEAILNALLAADTMVGRDGITAHRLAPDMLLDVMASHCRGRS